MDLFQENSYKKCIVKTLLFKKKSRPYFTFEALANHCNFQKSYISRVLKHKGNLTDDQLYLALEFLQLEESEKTFVKTLYKWEMTLLPERKIFYEKKINSIRSQVYKTESQIKVQLSQPTNQELTEYYTDPYFSLIHMFLTIPSYSEKPFLMAPHLGLTKKKITFYLEKLAELRIIEKQEQSWGILKNNMHLPSHSHLIKAYRNLLRLKSMEKMDQLSEPDFYSFSVVFSSEPKVKSLIHEKYLSLIREIQALVQNNSETNVYQMNFDLLSWDV